jgi:hypothetical protein
MENIDIEKRFAALPPSLKEFACDLAENDFERAVSYSNNIKIAISRLVANEFEGGCHPEEYLTRTIVSLSYISGILDEMIYDSQYELIEQRKHK